MVTEKNSCLWQKFVVYIFKKANDYEVKVLAKKAGRNTKGKIIVEYSLHVHRKRIKRDKIEVRIELFGSHLLPLVKAHKSGSSHIANQNQIIHIFISSFIFCKISSALSQN